MTAASRFSIVLLNPRESRVNHFIRVRIVRLCRSTWVVHIVSDSLSRMPKMIGFRSILMTSSRTYKEVF